MNRWRNAPRRLGRRTSHRRCRAGDRGRRAGHWRCGAGASDNRAGRAGRRPGRQRARSSCVGLGPRPGRCDPRPLVRRRPLRSLRHRGRRRAKQDPHQNSPQGRIARDRRQSGASVWINHRLLLGWNNEFNGFLKGYSTRKTCQPVCEQPAEGSAIGVTIYVKTTCNMKMAHNGRSHRAAERVPAQSYRPHESL